MRAFLLQVHRYCGLACLLFLSLAALTGCVLVFRGPIDRALNADLYAAPAAQGMSSGDNVAAVDAWAQRNPRIQVLGFPLITEPGRSIPVEVGAKPGEIAPAYDEVFLTPVSGEVVGTRDRAPAMTRHGFVNGVAEFHFDLLAGTWGRWLLGAVAALWFVLSLVGLYLTFPERGAFWKQWRRNWQFRRSSATPRLLLDLHRASGLWLLPFILLLAATSVALNFWGEFYAPTVTAISPLEHDLFDEDPPYPEGATAKLTFAEALPFAESHVREVGLEWEPARMLYMPDWNMYGVKFSPDGVLSYEKLGPVDHYFDADNGQWRHQVDPYNDTAGLVMIRVAYPLHSGEIFGFGSLLIVFVLGLVTFGQSATGLYLWLKKRPSRVAQRRRQRAQKEVRA